MLGQKPGSSENDRKVQAKHVIDLFIRISVGRATEFTNAQPSNILPKPYTGCLGNIQMHHMQAAIDERNSQYNDR